MEFEYLYSEIKRTGKRSHELTNELSESINNLMDVINSSNLFENEKIKFVPLFRFQTRTFLW